MKMPEIISTIAVAISVGALVFQWWQNRKASETAFKTNFLACTSRYTQIQELLLSNDELSGLSESIYAKINVPGDRDTRIFHKELALCGMMFQLIEDVCIMHGLDKNSNRKKLSGWDGLFRGWMRSKIIRDNWGELKNHYNENAQAYVGRLIGEK
jgi:hypothetical protein